MGGERRERMAEAFFAAVRAVVARTHVSFALGMLLVTALVLLTDVGLSVASKHVPHRAARIALAALLVVFNTGFFAAFFRAMRLVKAYDEAFGARDFVEVVRIREIIEGRGEPKGPAMRALRLVGDGELLLQFEKWSEAADAFARVDPDHLPEPSRPGVLSELGYARAHAGKVDKGVADIERALAQADAQKGYPAAKRWFLVRRHGVALSLAGEYERATDVLAPLKDDFAGSNREWSETFYFLGVSHAALGEREAAVGALGCAVFGDGPFVARAWKKLDEIADPDEVAMLRREVREEERKKKAS